MGWKLLRPTVNVSFGLFTVSLFFLWLTEILELITNVFES